MARVLQFELFDHVYHVTFRGSGRKVISGLARTGGMTGGPQTSASVLTGCACMVPNEEPLSPPYLNAGGESGSGNAPT